MEGDQVEEERSRQPAKGDDLLFPVPVYGQQQEHHQEVEQEQESGKQHGRDVPTGPVPGQEDRKPEAKDPDAEVEEEL
ncbi:hypothetical protein C1N53_21395 [Pontibacter sp. SGAir0037]|nr:hypothetical protein C1N53_21395 [Pontibacter sp. SGAir0037]